MGLALSVWGTAPLPLAAILLASGVGTKEELKGSSVEQTLKQALNFDSSLSCQPHISNETMPVKEQVKPYSNIHMHMGDAPPLSKCLWTCGGCNTDRVTVLRNHPNITHQDKNFRDVSGSGRESRLPWPVDCPMPATSVGAQTFSECCGSPACAGQVDQEGRCSTVKEALRIRVWVFEMECQVVGTQQIIRHNPALENLDLTGGDRLRNEDLEFVGPVQVAKSTEQPMQSSPLPFLLCKCGIPRSS
ncbi:uncharacterized protein LOC141580901 [Saimiri boliviensis]|uniref:uncharacterized protein LOC141580901 n=1 Tax=Saimiri boliviensis TaxID=27679 RepID=UPI003D7726A3